MITIDSVTFISFVIVNRLRYLVSALPLTYLMLSSPAAALPASLSRIIAIAQSSSPQLLGLVLICAMVGLLMIGDRRRRSRARSSAA